MRTCGLLCGLPVEPGDKRLKTLTRESGSQWLLNSTLCVLPAQSLPSGTELPTERPAVPAPSACGPSK